MTSSLDTKIMKAKEIKRLKKEQMNESTCNDDNTAIDDTSDSDDEDGNSNYSSDNEELATTTLEQKGAKQKSYFAKLPPMTDDISFTDMNLSRPLLKAVTSLGFTRPTPIQARTIPLALMGKDICGCAATGTGKTAAFMLPILERLLFRPSRIRSIRVLILLPTRELAIQVHAVGKALAKNSNTELCLAAGGLDLKGQEAALRRSPDIVIATPGRLVDHLHNTPSFSLQTIEILVLDEADRMLDEHFFDQLNEIIRLCPVSRQTLLFSATMTDNVEELIRLSLHEPVHVFVDSNSDTADNLQQEFIRIRSNREGDREAIIAALCIRTFKSNCLAFVPTKKLAHRLRIMLALLGHKTDELHGSLTQLQRLEALKNFKDGNVNVLFATDLAARGLDIDNVMTVINYSLPPTVKQYIHRVGRTARAGRSGRSVTLVGEKDRKVLKEIVKSAKIKPKSRVISAPVIERYKNKIRSFEGEFASILKQEEEEKQVRVAEMEMTKAKNMIVHHDEIYSKPARVWFQDSNKSKQVGKSNVKDERKRKRTEETDEEKKIRREMEFAKREEKRAKKSKKILAVPQDNKRPKGRKHPQDVITNKDEGSVKRSQKSKKVKVIVKSKGKKFKSKMKYKRK
jgi:ATP-dependent RNA helicase DDX27